MKELRGRSHEGKANAVAGSEPEAPSGFPVEPEWIAKNKIAHAEWDNTCKHLDSMGLLAITDHTVLETYCFTYSAWRQATNDLQKNGAVSVGQKGGGYVSPWQCNFLALSKQLQSLLTELGLTPAARARMRIVIDKKATSGIKRFIKVA
jgi:P27 family predicted phage terminase small subunit